MASATIDHFADVPESLRTQLALLIADLAEHAHDLGPERWGMSEHGVGIRFNVGWTEIATVMPDHLRLIISGDALAGRMLPSVVEINPPRSGTFYDSIPGSRLAVIPYRPTKSFAKSLDALRDAARAAVEVARRRRAGRGVRNGHRDELVRELAAHVGRPVPFPGLQPEENNEAAMVEGALKRVVSSRFERDPAARAACIAHHGSDCAVCGFSFGARYGALGAGFIHVHHVVPLSQIREDYVIDPVRDLIPVCPNCHAMLHKSAETLTIEGLRGKLEPPR